MQPAQPVIALQQLNVPLIQQNPVQNAGLDLSKLTPEQLRAIQGIISQQAAPQSGVYLGPIAQPVRNNEPAYRYNDGSTYEGEMLNGKPHGKGIKTYPLASDYKSYVGTFVDGKFDGEGTFLYKSGRKYQGEFKNNEYNGQGREEVPGLKNHLLKGRFENDHLVEGELQWSNYERGNEVRHSWKGTFYLLNNDYKLKDGEYFNGVCTRTYKNSLDVTPNECCVIL